MEVVATETPAPAAPEGDVIVTVVTPSPEDSSATDSVQQLRAEMMAGFTELKDMIVGAAAVTVAAVADTEPAMEAEPEVATIEAAPAPSTTTEDEAAAGESADVGGDRRPARNALHRVF